MQHCWTILFHNLGPFVQYLSFIYNNHLREPLFVALRKLAVTFFSCGCAFQGGCFKTFEKTMTVPL